jgi:hypothetical protein
MTPPRPLAAIAVPPPFDISDWYWFVAGSTTQVYSSKAKDFVPATNTAYQRWLADGKTPTNIDTPFNLGVVLAERGDMNLQPIAAGVLDGFSDTVAARTTATYLNRLLFEYENRLRAIEGQPAMSATDFRQKIKGLVS